MISCPRNGMKLEMTSDSQKVWNGTVVNYWKWWGGKVSPIFKSNGREFRGLGLNDTKHKYYEWLRQDA